MILEVEENALKGKLDVTKDAYWISWTMQDI